MFDALGCQGAPPWGALPWTEVDPVVAALAAQQAELSDVLDGLADDAWHAPSRCEGWDVADVVLHLAQTDEMAIASLDGRLDEWRDEIAGDAGPAASVDDGAAMLVARQRGGPVDELRARWKGGAARLVDTLDATNLSNRVTWVAGELSARTLATTRLAETWIHSGDVAHAVGIKLAPTERLWPIARLAWRTLPYAFASAGRSLSGPVAFRLLSPEGEPWDFLPDTPALTAIAGSAEELCAVAARRVEAGATGLKGTGPDAEGVLALVRTYA
jgi:uncharacterized protein (TIGR03084 family)